MFTFSVKSYKLTALAILSMLLLYRPLHCVRTNPQASISRISSLLSQYEQQYDSESYCLLTNQLLGYYFYRMNLDLVTATDAITKFEKSESVTDFVKFLNRRVLVQIDQCKSVDQTGQSYFDEKRRDQLFHKFICTITEEMRPFFTSWKVRALRQPHWTYVLSLRIPLLQRTLADPSYVDLDSTDKTNTSWLERAIHSLTEKPMLRGRPSFSH